MRFLNIVLKKTVTFTVFQSVIPKGTRKCLFLGIPHKPPPCRTLLLSLGMRKEDAHPLPTEKLNLDEWKNIMKSSLPEEASDEILEREGDWDSSLTAIRELVEMWRLAGKAVPESISEEQLKVLMELPTKSSRRKYLKHLAIKERFKNAKKAKKEKLKAERNDTLERPVAAEEQRAPRNSFFLTFWQRSIDNLHLWRAAQSMLFGQPLVFDMVYDKVMSRREMENTVNQLLETEGWNRKSPDPFHIHFCSLHADGPYHEELLKRYGEAWDKLLLTATEKAHVDLFPKGKLVYLTADSPNVMKMYEHDKIYIIGSLVDKSQQTGLSLANAKRLNLATARLPLEKFLHWETGAKNLTLDQMIRILLTLKDTGDWQQALAFVPKRKHEGFIDIQKKMELERKRKMYQFGSRTKNIDKPSAGSLTKGSKQKRWWEED
ncbi:tRNA methyltransferase 10 homolog C [Rhinatrema bivittatum]|uniref:tRNA methyltransferase 10 homolog C n=1 Tax=Rhinatrema bivittatum TaxID=194408 RepID=UPI001128ABB4|nr:tRNA methyltransferase 10 homolog C [Rhinatrema bivittatum]